MTLKRFASEAGNDGSAQSRSGTLLYSRNLEEVVPDDHLVREIAEVLDLSWVNSELEPFYPRTGFIPC